ncbi:O-antigen ligase [Parvularcula sp. IMCC14364]|uniref:O-antigen ligase family protein n=1 Tax=Parvularcula sp. IMCC14364 TaxID=3067902 RepID=UPI0027404F54|nr:O-antigen ligase family protein [Parvularcula sp. IMCC14364]
MSVWPQPDRPGIVQGPGAVRGYLVPLVFCGILSTYIFLATAISIIFPAFLLLAIAPVLPLLMLAASDMKPVPLRFTRRLVYLGALLMPLWPVYLHVKLGPLPIITPTRVLFYSIIAIWLYEMACVPRRRVQFVSAMRRVWPLFLVIALLFAHKFLTVPLAMGKGIAAKEFIRQSMIWLLPFLAVMTYVQRRQVFDRALSLIIFSSTVVALIALVEFVTQTHFAEVIAPLMGDVEWLRQVLQDKVRDGVFRSQATHTHPLSLGEHLAMIIPFAMYKIYRGGNFGRRLFYGGVLIILVSAVLMSNSRGALIGGMMAFSVTAFLMLTTWLRKPESLPFRPLAGMAIALAILASPIVIGAGYKVVVGDDGTTASASSQARIAQMETAWPKIIKRPLYGYGNGRAARVLGFYGGRLTIDNYYLNLALELGFPGPILFFGSFAMLAWYGWRWGTDLGDDPYAGLYIAVAGMAISFAVTRSILSITTNIELFMLLAALMIGTCGRTKYLLALNRKDNIPTEVGDFAPVLTAKQFEQHRERVLSGKSLWTPVAR